MTNLKTLVVVTAVAFATQGHAAVTFNGLDLDGVNAKTEIVNGIERNGLRQNGRELNGRFVQGTQQQGVKIHRTDHPSLHTVAPVDFNALTIIDVLVPTRD